MRSACIVVIAGFGIAMWAAGEFDAPEVALSLNGDIGHVQGLAVEGDQSWVSSVHKATKKGLVYSFSMRDGRLLHSVEVQNQNRYHPGGISLDSTSLTIGFSCFVACGSAKTSARRAPEKSSTLIPATSPAS